MSTLSFAPRVFGLGGHEKKSNDTPEVETNRETKKELGDETEDELDDEPEDEGSKDEIDDETEDEESEEEQVEDENTESKDHEPYVFHSPGGYKPIGNILRLRNVYGNKTVTWFTCNDEKKGECKVIQFTYDDHPGVVEVLCTISEMIDYLENESQLSENPHDEQAAAARLLKRLPAAQNENMVTFGNWFSDAAGEVMLIVVKHPAKVLSLIVLLEAIMIMLASIHAARLDVYKHAIEQYPLILKCLNEQTKYGDHTNVTNDNLSTTVKSMIETKIKGKTHYGKYLNDTLKAVEGLRLCTFFYGQQSSTQVCHLITTEEFEKKLNSLVRHGVNKWASVSYEGVKFQQAVFGAKARKFGALIKVAAAVTPFGDQTTMYYIDCLEVVATVNTAGVFLSTYFTLNFFGAKKAVRYMYSSLLDTIREESREIQNAVKGKESPRIRNIDERTRQMVITPYRAFLYVMGSQDKVTIDELQNRCCIELERIHKISPQFISESELVKFKLKIREYTKPASIKTYMTKLKDFLDKKP